MRGERAERFPLTSYRSLLTPVMKLLSPAKINLFLHVTGKRPDRYHELFTLMVPVGLYDTISLEFGTREIKVSCADPDVPEDETNLAYRAADLFFRTINMNEGAGIFIEKKIPVGAGLGGGSSNAATVLSGLNQYYDSPFSYNELISMARSLGADVPFFILGKPAIGTGIGADLEPYFMTGSFKILLIFPGFKVSTAEVYKNLNLRLTECKNEFINRLFKEREFDPGFLCNDLETVTALKYPDIIRIKSLVMEHGAEGSLMSGSGPTVFGLFSDIQNAREAKAFFLKQNDRWRVYLTDMIV